MKMDRYTSPLSYGWAAFVASFGAITLNEWAVIVGIATGLGTFAVNWYYKHKDTQHRMRMREKKQ